ncbi:MAG: TauD/TfdA family dioxygenase [Burkholderiaceae bacterium]
MIMHSPVSGPSVWTRESFVDDVSWQHHFDASQKDEMQRAIEVLAGLDLADIKDAERMLPSLVPLVQKTKRELAERGFVLLRGAPVEGLDEKTCRNLFWAIGMLYGSGMSQNTDGDFVCPVTDTGVKFGYDNVNEAFNTRGYQSNADLKFHCDSRDLVGLLCLRKAKSGGKSLIVSSPTIYNEILRQRPHYIEHLCRGFILDRKNQNWPEQPPVSPRTPVFFRHPTRVSCRYGRGYINSGGAKVGEPLTDFDCEVLDFFDVTASREDLALQMEFEPGDIQLLNNFLVLHGRTAYVDDPDPARRRFLYRIHLELPEASPWEEEPELMRRAYSRSGNLGFKISETGLIRR